VSDAVTITTPADKVLSNLKRVRGQLDGIIKMYESERSCVDIVRQVIAARGSLGRVAHLLMSNEATRCSHQRRPEELDEILKEVFKY
jgi:DNA-binding FrmR family transcriptional regulator